MTDTTIRPVSFGYFLVPNVDDPLLETARRVEELGLDYVGIQDHPYQRQQVDTWSLMSMIAAQTTTLRIFPDVANLPLRLPSVMANAAATIDRLSGGRFELGLGAGGFWDAIVGYGGTRRSPGESLDALEEAITVIRRIWSEERGIRFEGEHYHLTGAHGGPGPVHDIGIWLGVYGPRALRLAARIADGWVPSYQGDIDRIVSMARQMDEALDEADRSRDALRRVLNVSGMIRDGRNVDARGDGAFDGPVDRWVENLIRMRDECGFDTFVFWGDGDDQLERFAREVVPAAREHLDGQD